MLLVKLVKRSYFHGRLSGLRREWPLGLVAESLIEGYLVKTAVYTPINDDLLYGVFLKDFSPFQQTVFLDEKRLIARGDSHYQTSPAEAGLCSNLFAKMISNRHFKQVRS